MATEEDKTNSGALITLVAVSTFAMIAVTLAVTAIARDEMSQVREEKEGPGGDQYQELRRKQIGSLANGVPIQQSMLNVVQGLARDPGSATPPTPVTTATAAAIGAAAAGGAAAAAGGAPATAVPTPAPAASPDKPGAAPKKPASAPKAAPAAPVGNPAAQPAKPLAPQPTSGTPSPAAPPAAPHG
jgi:hypothetical protein